MSGAIPPLPQYAFIAWCSVKKAQEQLYLAFTLTCGSSDKKENFAERLFIEVSNLGSYFENSSLKFMPGDQLS